MKRGPGTFSRPGRKGRKGVKKGSKRRFSTIVLRSVHPILGGNSLTFEGQVQKNPLFDPPSQNRVFKGFWTQNGTFEGLDPCFDPKWPKTHFLTILTPQPSIIYIIILLSQRSSASTYAHNIKLSFTVQNFLWRLGATATTAT